MPKGRTRAILPSAAVLLVLLIWPPFARAAEGDVFTKGIKYCASTHPGHGTLSGFGPAIDINGSGADDYRWPVYAPGDGRVTIYSSGGGWGNSLIWTSASGRERIHLAHLDSFGKTGSVRAGDLIGRVGNTGYSDGSHLHASARRGDGPARLVLGGRVIHVGSCYVSPGPDVPTCRGRAATVVGTRGRDALVGTRRADVIVGRGGADRIAGRGGRDLVCAGKGDDVVRGGHGVDRLVGGWGKDILTGDRGPDRLAGQGGIDRLAGGSGDDDLRGGPGRDRASFAGSTKAVSVDLAGGWARGEGRDAVTAIENVTGSRFADELTGDGRANELVGGAGNDLLAGGAGNDDLRGGAGRDRASFARSARAVRVNLDGGWARGEGTDELVAIEVVSGTRFADELMGDARANTLLGRAGDDLLDGAAGMDGAMGGPGTDTCVAEETEDCEPEDPVPSPSPTPSR